MIITIFPVYSTANAVKTNLSDTGSSIYVKIESFARGDVGKFDKDGNPIDYSGLRSSELLMARVYGYSGNESELTYRWTNELHTQIYVYNTSDLSVATGTTGEQEIYNTQNEVPKSADMGNRSSDKTFQGKGFQYAVVAGYYTSAEYALSGSFKVEVIDSNGNVIATNEIKGEETETSEYVYNPVTRRYELVTVKTIGQALSPYDLKEDLNNAVFGLFEGDTVDSKKLFTNSSAVCLDCKFCSVISASVSSGYSEYLKVENNETFDVTGLKETPKNNPAKMDVTVKKKGCKFHPESQADANPYVYVFKKPKTETSSRTLTLYKDVRSEYDYYIIDKATGQKTKGEKVGSENPTVTFTGLTPETEYTVEVVAPYIFTDVRGVSHERYATAYVYDTTKPERIAKVNVRLDGDNVKLSGVGLNDLYLKNADVGAEAKYYFDEVTESKVYYKTSVSNGTYFIYSGEEKFKDINLVVNNSDVETNLDFYSVNYAPNGENVTNMPESANYYNGSVVMADDKTPAREGYIFLGWKSSIDENNIQPSGLVTNSITSKVTLTAQWVKVTNVKVNVTINHGLDADDYSVQSKADFFLAKRMSESEEWTNVEEKILTEDSYEGYTFNHENNITKYIANDFTFKNVDSRYAYSVTTKKNNYSVEITTEKDGNDNTIVNVVYTFNPKIQNIKFKVQLDEKLKNLSHEYKPQSANVKVTVYDPEDETQSDHWRNIKEHNNVNVTVKINESGESDITEVPVWGFGSDNYQYHFRISVVSLVYPDGSIVDTNTNDKIDFVDSNGIYSAKVEVTGGQAPQGSSLEGAYFTNALTRANAEIPQTGEITATISADFYNVVFVGNGGKVNDEETVTVSNVMEIPGLQNYKATREGGYVFAGWYMDETFTKKAVEGVTITPDMADSDRNVYLYAKWTSPVTLKGKVKVQYDYNGSVMQESDEIHNTTMVVERSILGRENWNTYTSVTIDFDSAEVKADAYSVKDYEITGLPKTDDNGNEYSYRIVITQQNYTVSYDPQVAEFTDNVGEANAELNFTPETFTLPFEVDATSLPEYMNISKINVVYEFKVDESSKDWQTVAQHRSGTQDDPGKVSYNSYEENKQTGSSVVWKYSNNYDLQTTYRLKVVSYVLNGETVNVNDDNSLVNVFIDNTAKCSDNAKLLAHLEPKDKEIIFHDNLSTGEDMFRTYHTEDVVDLIKNYLKSIGKEDEADKHFKAETKDNKYLVKSFYDIPTTVNNKSINNDYVFKGWYLDKDNNKDSRPISWTVDTSAEFNGATNVYAHWIAIDEVDKNSEDTKQTGSNVYNGFDLIGVQIRDAKYDDYWNPEDGTQKTDDFDETGLRFITVLSENVYRQLTAVNGGKFEYGYALAKEKVAKAYQKYDAKDDPDYELKYSDTNSNGEDTSFHYDYISNIDCTIPDKDHFNCDDYRLFTAVITYKGLSGNDLTNAQSEKIVARAYMKYKDANGLINRVHYNDYTGTPVFKGCSSSFTDAKSAIKPN